MMADTMLHDLPASELIRAGVRDLLDSRVTIPALVVSIARGQLVGKGVLPDSAPVISAEPERALYQLLRAQDGDPYARYNALIRELVSFVSALDSRLRRGKVA